MESQILTYITGHLQYHHRNSLLVIVVVNTGFQVNLNCNQGEL